MRCESRRVTFWGKTLVDQQILRRQVFVASSRQLRTMRRNQPGTFTSKAFHCLGESSWLRIYLSAGQPFHATAISNVPSCRLAACTRMRVCTRSSIRSSLKRAGMLINVKLLKLAGYSQIETTMRYIHPEMRSAGDCQNRAASACEESSIHHSFH